MHGSHGTQSPLNAQAHQVGHIDSSSSASRAQRRLIQCGCRNANVYRYLLLCFSSDSASLRLVSLTTLVLALVAVPTSAATPVAVTAVPLLSPVSLRLSAMSQLLSAVSTPSTIPSSATTISTSSSSTETARLVGPARLAKRVKVPVPLLVPADAAALSAQPVEEAALLVHCRRLGSSHVVRLRSPISRSGAARSAIGKSGRVGLSLRLANLLWTRTGRRDPSAFSLLLERLRSLREVKLRVGNLGRLRRWAVVVAGRTGSRARCLVDGQVV